MAGALGAAGFAQPRREARWLLEAALGLEPAAAVLDPHAPVGDRAAWLSEVFRRRLGHEPLSRILARRSFFGLEFQLAPATLDPRPDTEVLVEAVLDHASRRGLDRRPVTIADLGTGSGAILAALLTYLPLATGLGADLSGEALEAASANVARICGPHRATFRRSDWFAAIEGRFDIIVANPPYISTVDLAGLDQEVRLHDPVLALDGGADGLDAYRALALAMVAHLHPCGLCAVEIGIGQARSVVALFQGGGMEITDIRRDLSGIDRVIIAEPAK